TEKSQRRKIKNAGFPYIKTINDLDTGRFEHISDPFIKELVSCDFIKKRQNIVMIGNPGTGKTHLSIALGIKACMQGINVKFYTAANLANELIEAQEYKKLIRLEKQIIKAELLIIDELCKALHNSSYGKSFIMQSWNQKSLYSNTMFVFNFT
ncbi:MAG: ATP-binding protein, partial [Alkaliphilus sp.]|nr:ATP-binding protein [Alkaliphilus sp.]